METQNSNQTQIQNQVQNQTGKVQDFDRKRASDFKNFFLITLIYAVFYTFCLYKNYSGITYPLFACGTLYFLNILFKKTESGSLKENKLISAAIVFTSIITTTTDSEIFIHFNKNFIILLFVILILKTVFKTKFQKWTIEQFFTCILNSLYDLFANLFAPFKDYLEFKKEKTLNLAGDDRLSKEKALKKQMQLSVLKGLLIAIPLLIIIITLLGTADVLFQNALNNFTGNFTFVFSDGNLFLILLMIFAIFVCVYAFFKGIFLSKTGRNLYNNKLEIKTYDSVTGITAASIISAVYLLFAGIQIFGLFLNMITLPSHISYADYVKSGFKPLLWVVVINIVTVYIFKILFKENIILKILLTVITGCTFIIEASTLYRLVSYINYIHCQLTVPRILGLFALFVSFLFTAGILILIYKPDFNFRKFIMTSFVCSYMVLTAIHPEYAAAKFNAASYENGEKIDFQYMYNLSSDAAPVWSSYTPAKDDEKDFTNACFDTIKKADEMNIRDFNFSRYFGAQSVENLK